MKMKLRFLVGLYVLCSTSAMFASTNQSELEAPLEAQRMEPSNTIRQQQTIKQFLHSADFKNISQLQNPEVSTLQERNEVRSFQKLTEDSDRLSKERLSNLKNDSDRLSKERLSDLVEASRLELAGATLVVECEREKSAVAPQNTVLMPNDVKVVQKMKRYGGGRKTTTTLVESDDETQVETQDAVLTPESAVQTTSSTSFSFSAHRPNAGASQNPALTQKNDGPTLNEITKKILAGYESEVKQLGDQRGDFKNRLKQYENSFFYWISTFFVKLPEKTITRLPGEKIGEREKALRCARLFNERHQQVLGENPMNKIKLSAITNANLDEFSKAVKLNQFIQQYDLLQAETAYIKAQQLRIAKYESNENKVKVAMAATAVTTVAVTAAAYYYLNKKQ